MKKFFQKSQVVVVMMLSVFLFSCEKSEMDSFVPTAEAATLKKGINQRNINNIRTVAADSAYIISFYDAGNVLTTEADVQALAQTIGGQIAFEQTYWEGIKGFAAPLTQQQVTAFRNDPRVETVENDGPITPITMSASR